MLLVILLHHNKILPEEKHLRKRQGKILKDRCIVIFRVVMSEARLCQGMEIEENFETNTLMSVE